MKYACSAVVWCILSSACYAAQIDVTGKFTDTDGQVYSADPTGVADSTLAIQLAAKKAIWQNVTNKNGYIDAQTPPTIYFPDGVYKITRPIQFFPVCKIKGDNAIINNVGITDSFVFSGAADVEVDGIRIVGGKVGMNFGNPNINATMYTISRCRFDKTTDVAIGVKGTADSIGTMSAMLNISACRFRECYGVVSTYCDNTTMKDCWIQWSTASGSPASGSRLFCITNHRGRLNLERCMLIPQDFTVTPINYSWVANYGIGIRAFESHFGGENGGIPIVSNFNHPNDPGGVPQSYVTYMGATLHFEKCQLSAGPAANTTSCVIDMQGLASVTIIDGCDYLIQVPIIRLGQTAKNELSIVKNKPKVKIGINQSWPDVTINWPKQSRCAAELFPYMTR